MDLKKKTTNLFKLQTCIVEIFPPNWNIQSSEILFQQYVLSIIQIQFNFIKHLANMIFRGWVGGVVSHDTNFMTAPSSPHNVNWQT